ncbi:MAG: two-component system, OmpR family, response regulator [Chthoniobacter sp.]|jgi:CheY-like chemotaxis protein|nr:two-component system, OmpR family, response regulator [Chthoniobacter sp.]
MNKPKILIVDDESGFTRLIKIALRKYEIREENDSLRALDVAREFHPDLIVLDVIMPGLDGGDVAAAIRVDPKLRHTPIIFLTATVSPKEAGTEPKLIGGYPFLAKPVSPAALEKCIEENLRL